MKKLFILLIISIISIQAQDEKAIKSFNKIVEQFKTFFSESHKYYSFQGTNQGVHSIRIYIPHKISYDAVRTESILSPFIGYIIIDYQLLTNSNCIESDGFDSPEEAFTYIDSIGCYEFFNPSLIDRVDKFVFTYDNKKWNLKEIVDQSEKQSNTSFLFGFDYPFENKKNYKLGIELNNQWKFLK